MTVPDEAFAVMRKRKKVVTRELIFMLSSFWKDGSFFISRHKEKIKEKRKLICIENLSKIFKTSEEVVKKFNQIKDLFQKDDPSTKSGCLLLLQEILTFYLSKISC